MTTNEVEIKTPMPKRKRPRVEKWDSDIYKMMLKQYAHCVPEEKGRPKLTMDKWTMRIFNSLMDFTLQRMIEELRNMTHGSGGPKATLTERDVFFASRMLLPHLVAKKENDLYESALVYAQEAIAKYEKTKTKRTETKPKVGAPNPDVGVKVVEKQTPTNKKPKPKKISG